MTYGTIYDNIIKVKNMDDYQRNIILFDPYEILAVTKVYAEGFLLLTENKKILATDMRYYYPVNEFLQGKGYEVIAKSDYKTLKDAVKRCNITDLYANFSSITAETYNRCLAEGVSLKDGTVFIGDMLALKDSYDLTCISKACGICEKSYKEIMPYVKQGVSELDLSAELEYRFKRNGASCPSFETIVAFGKNSAVPHHKTDNTKLKKGDVVLIDCGCVYNGFMSDMTRTFAYKSAKKEFISVYEKVKKAHYKSINGIKSGMTGVEADNFARQSLKEDKLDKYFTHSLGHGVGTHIHELPLLSPRSTSVLKDGMVFSIEPGVYFDGQYGIRIEDTVTLTNGVVQSFVKLSKELEIIDME